MDNMISEGMAAQGRAAMSGSTTARESTTTVRGVMSTATTGRGMSTAGTMTASFVGAGHTMHVMDETARGPTALGAVLAKVTPGMLIACMIGIARERHMTIPRTQGSTLSCRWWCKGTLVSVTWWLQ